MSDTKENIEYDDDIEYEFDDEEDDEVQGNVQSDQLSLAELNLKVLLTVEEASRLFGIGICKLRKRMKEPKCPYVFFIGNKKKLIDRSKLEQYIHEHRMF